MIINYILIMIGGIKVATKKTNKKESNKREITNGALILLIIFSILIGFLCGWLFSNIL